MDLSSRDAFRPCSRDVLCGKGQTCFVKPKKNVIGVSTQVVER